MSVKLRSLFQFAVALVTGTFMAFLLVANDKIDRSRKTVGREASKIKFSFKKQKNAKKDANPETPDCFI